MPDVIDVGDRIRAARQALGTTQEELARAVGLPAAQTVSSIERGERAVKAAELVRFADALHRTVDELLGLESRPEVRVLWRRDGREASRDREEELVERARRYALVEKWSNASPADQLPDHDFNVLDQPWLDRFGFAEAGRLAPRVARILDLGSRPAASLQAVLEERFGLKLFFEDLEGEESAACTRGDFGCAVLMNAKQAPWRRNFNLAHELFHLVTWRAVERAWQNQTAEPGTFETVEKVANAFASHLLLPAAELESQFDLRFPSGETNDVDLIELAREFGVSTEALLWRLRFMGKLSQNEVEARLADPAFRQRDRRTMPGHWEQPERGLPPRYRRLARAAYEKGEITLARLAQVLETSIGEVVELGLEGTRGEEATAAPA